MPVANAPKPPAAVPRTGIKLPAAAPPAVAAVNSSESTADLAKAAIDDTNTCGAIVGLLATPFIKPHIPLPSSSYILLKSIISSDVGKFVDSL